MARIVVIAGGYRTGSTLQYNLLGTYLEHSGLGRRGGYVTPDDADQFVAAVAAAGRAGADRADRADELIVVKCHQIAAEVLGFDHPTAWGAHVRQGHALAVTTVRDIASTERSMCRKFGIDPAELHASVVWRENEANVAAWAALVTLTQHYDDLTQRPARALRRLLHALDVPARRRSVRYACAATAPGVMIAHQQCLEQGTWDPVTLVHWDHIATDSPVS
jgi:hypothetical protein